MLWKMELYQKEAFPGKKESTEDFDTGKNNRRPDGLMKTDKLAEAIHAAFSSGKMLISGNPESG